MEVDPPMESFTPPSVRILEAIARLDDIDPLEMEPGLNEVIDTDALDHLIRHESREFTLEFSYGTHHVLVTEEAIHIDGKETIPLS